MPGKRRIRQRNSRRPRGQALIEFALVLPILLLLILGAMDIGRLFTTKIVLTNAAREGANYLSRNSDDDWTCSDGVCYYAGTWNAIEEEGSYSGINLVKSDVVWANTNCCTPGSSVEITIIKTVDLIFGSFLQSMFSLDGQVEISSSVKMRVQ